MLSRFLKYSKTKVLPVKKQIAVCNKLAMLLNAGMPISKAVKMSGMPEACEKSILDGENISKAIEPYFDRTVTSFSSIGEKTAGIDKMFRLAAEVMEFNSSLKQKIIGAFIYPSIVFLTSIMTAVFFVMYIIPQMAGVFSSIGTELPPSSIFLMNVSAAMPYMIVFLLIFSVILAVLIKRGAFSERIEKLKFRLPILGKIFRKMTAAEISKNISFLLMAGMPAVDVLHEASKMTSSKIYSDALARIKDMVEGGTSISSAFSKETMFEKEFSEMLMVGEETGNIDTIIEGMSKVLEEEAHCSIKTAAALIEPLSTVFVGVFVAFIVITMMSPMVKILTSL